MLVILQAHASPLQPFNYNYEFNANDSTVYNTDITQLNEFKGGVYQQSVSALTVTDETAYELNGGSYSVYGFEYQPGFDNAARNLSYGHPRMTEFWAVYHLDIEQPAKLDGVVQCCGCRSDGRDQRTTYPPRTNGMCTLMQYAALTEMAAQYILMNLALSMSFAQIDFSHQTFPATMRVDYIRVYQNPDQLNIGCDPEAFPTAAYINTSVHLLVSMYSLLTYSW